MARDSSPRFRLVLLALGGLAAACGPAPVEPSRPTTPAPRPSSLPVAGPPSVPLRNGICPGDLATAAPDRGWFALGASAPPTAATPAPSPGVVSPSAGPGAFPSAVYDAEGRLVVAWAEAPGVQVRRLEGGHFRELPPITARNVDGFDGPKLTRDASGRPLVYFFEDQRPRVVRIEGNTLVDLSPKSPPPARFFGVRGPPRIVTCLAVVVPVARTRLVVDGEGRPLVGWTEAGPTSMRAVVHRWTGAAWVTWSHPGIGEIDDCAPNSAGIHLTADPKGQPYIAFRKDRAYRVLVGSGGGGFREEATLVPERDAAHMSEPWITFGPKNVRFRAWNESVLQGGHWHNRVQVWRSDEKGSRPLKQPADRPLTGQIVGFGGGERPRIAVLDKDARHAELRFVAWENDAPVELTGGPGAAQFSTAQTHAFPSVALPEGSAPPAVVYRGGTEVAVRVWSEGAYRAPGGGDAEAEDGLGRGVAEGVPPALAMRGGKVAVAWLTPGAFPSVVVRQWTGCRWETAPAIPVQPDERPGPGLRPALTIDAEGRVLLVYSTTAARAMVAARWATATSWELLHVPRNGPAPGGSHAPAALAFGVEVEPSGEPVFAWADRVHGKLETARYLGPEKGFRLISSDPAPVVIEPAMTTDDTGRAVVGMLDWQRRSAFVGYVRRIQDDRFVEVPPWTSPPTPNSGFPPERFDLAAGPAGALALAFRWNRDDPPYVALWNGSSWNTISAPGVAGVVGDAPGPGGSPAITFDEAGGLRVAYADRASGEILVKRFFGGAWSESEVGGSAKDSVSRSEAASVDPVIAASGGAVCVAWSERAGGEGRVLVRCRK